MPSIDIAEVCAVGVARLYVSRVQLRLQLAELGIEPDLDGRQGQAGSCEKEIETTSRR